MNNPEKNSCKCQRTLDVKRLVGIAMFAALAYGVTFVFRIPVMFLTFDAKDAVITIASLMYGPFSAVVISLITVFIEFITISGTGVYGFIMNFASSATFAFTASLIYKFKRSTVGAIIGFYTACVAMVSVMLVLNIFVTPYYMMGEGTLQAARESVIGLIPTLILPFNAAKALLNSAIAMLLYKPVSLAMRRSGLLVRTVKISSNGVSGVNRGRVSVPMLVASLTTLAVAIIMFVLLKL